MRMSVAALFLVMVGSPGLASAQPSSDPPRQLIGLGRAMPGAEPSQPAPPQIPPRDAKPTPPKTGTAVLRGRVVDGNTRQPVARVRVRLSGSGGSDTLVTEASGVFAFTNLPAGRYYLALSRRGYMTGTYPELTRTLRGRTGLTVAEGQVLENVTAQIYRGGAITGRLMDAYGDPIDNVSVQAVPSGRLSQSFQMSSANDIGEYRVSQLPPATYLLVATPHGGRWDPSDTSDAPVPTYYPGVLSPDQAQPIVVQRGQTVTGMDFQVVEQPVISVTGAVLDASGQPAANGNISVEGDNTFGGGGWSGGGAGLKPDGTFQLKLPPGEYRLVAFANRRDPNRDANQGSPATRVAQFDDQPQMGMVRLSVGTEPIANLVIATGHGSTISGRLVFDGDSAPPDPARITVNAQAPSTIAAAPWIRRGGDCRSSRPGRVNADLTFTMEGVRGICVLSANVQDAHWRVRSAIYHGADLLDRPVDLMNNRVVRDVQVSLTTKRTELTADVSGDQGESLQDYVLLAFSTDKARWTLARYVAYTMRSSDPPSTTAGPLAIRQSLGTASAMRRPGSLTSLPAGEYYVVALDDLGVDDSRDASFYEQFVPNATRVTLREGEPQTVQLRRIKTPAPAS